MNIITEDMLKPGFNYFKLIDNKWLQYEVYKELTSKEITEIMNEVEAGTILVEVPSKFKTFFDSIKSFINPYYSKLKGFLKSTYPYIYSALFSVAFIVLFFICIFGLNYIDLQNPTTDGSVMLTGTKVEQLCLYVLAIHCGCVTIANLIDWSTSNFKSYIYRNPKLFKNKFDETSDLDNTDNPTTKFRILWFQIKFYVFYFVSILIAMYILGLKMYLGVN